MEIRHLKQQLSAAGIGIFEVAERLGIRINKYHKANCPFHEDKRPSLQFSKEKQIATCFSANCDAGTMDVLNLVEKYLKLSTKEAMRWLITEFSLQEKLPLNKGEHKGVGVNYPQLFRNFQGNAKKSSKAKAYLTKRSLPEGLEVGYNGTGWDKMKNCLIFPLRNSSNEIVSFYGRSVLAEQHYYSTNRKGLYPSYPKADTEVLILTESIIDSATLKPFTDHTLLALYGVHGFTSEHEQAIENLSKLKTERRPEVILFFDGDTAGRQAVEKVGQQLQKLHPTLQISSIATPEGEDVNSLAVNHPEQEAALFSHLLKNRKPIGESNQEVFSFSEGGGHPSNEAKASPIATPKPKARFNSDNAELLYFTAESVQITVLGGIKITGLDRLRVTLKIESLHKGHLLPIRHNLDLYHNGQLEQLAQKVAEQMSLTNQAAITLLSDLINYLEQYRAERLEAMKPKKDVRPVLSAIEKAQAMNVLQAENLMEQTRQLLAKSGIVGEANNSLIAYLIYTSRKRSHPLHLMCLGASGTGKTHLQEKVSALIPEEDKLAITTISENAFYYFGKTELQHKVILIEDLDGAQSVMYPIRELQTKRAISKTVTLKDSKGNLKTVHLVVKGPVCISGCTTQEKIYEDNANRCILIYIDSSKVQDERIQAYLQAQSAGRIDKVAEQAIIAQVQNMQRLLKHITVRNPYAPLIDLPESVFKPRRTLGLLLGFIEVITYYHQHQREVKTDAHTQEKYIETTPKDVEWAFELLKDVLFAKSDELTKACRDFLERLKGHLDNPHDSFYSKQIRKGLRINPSNLKRYLIELSRYGYVRIAGGSKYKGYEYQVVDSQEYEKLRQSITKKLEEIMANIKAQAKSSQAA